MKEMVLAGRKVPHIVDHLPTLLTILIGPEGENLKLWRQDRVEADERPREDISPDAIVLDHDLPPRRIEVAAVRNLR
jgi:hypothetical protein